MEVLVVEGVGPTQLPLRVHVANQFGVVLFLDEVTARSEEDGSVVVAFQVADIHIAKGITLEIAYTNASNICIDLLLATCSIVANLLDDVVVEGEVHCCAPTQFPVYLHIVADGGLYAHIAHLGRVLIDHDAGCIANWHIEVGDECVVEGEVHIQPIVEEQEFHTGLEGLCRLWLSTCEQPRTCGTHSARIVVARG